MFDRMAALRPPEPAALGGTDVLRAAVL